MRTLVIAPDVNCTGGIGAYSLNIVQALAGLYGTGAVGLSVLVASSGLVEARRYASTARAGDNRLSRAGKLRFLVSTLDQCIRLRPEVVVCTHVNLSPVARLGSRLASGDYIVAAHGLEVWNPLSGLRQWGLLGSRLIVAVSEFTREQVVAVHGIQHDRTRSLRNVVAPRLLETPPDHAFLERHSLVDRPYLLLVGRMATDERYKGHEVAIRAMVAVKETLPGAALVIAGGGDDQERLASLARALRVEKQVLFTGQITNSELAALYRGCRGLVMPCSLEQRNGRLVGEGFGIVFLEAAAFGKPAIAGKFGASSEAVVDGETGILVDPADVNDVAQAMIRLLVDRDFASSLGACGRDRVLRDFSFAGFRSTLGSILNEVAARSRKRD